MFRLWNAIVLRTPVDTGRARGNWNVAEGFDDSSTSDSTSPKYASADSLPVKDGTNEDIYISNNLPYIGVLEYGGYPNPPKNPTGKTVNGYSRQAPNGMVGVTVASAEKYLEETLRSVVK